MVSVAVSMASVVVLPSAPASAASAAPVPEWDPTSVPAIGSISTTGPRIRTVQNDVIGAATPVAVSTTPSFEWTKVPAGTAQVQFQVREIGTLAPRVLWTSSWVNVAKDEARARVPVGILHDGQTYSWGAISKQSSQVLLGPFHLPVDTQRTDVQPLWDAAGVGVTEATGEPVVSWSSPSLATLAGSAGFSLIYRPSNASAPGLPTGWALSTRGERTRWESLTRPVGSNVITLTTASGWSVQLRRGGGGAYEPLFGASATWPNGTEASVFENPDGSFRVLDANAQVTSFPAPTQATTTVWPSSMWINGAPVLAQQFESGRLVSLTDPVSGRSVTFSYAPAPSCAAPSTGFVAAPSGDLCRVDAWDGTVTELSYVATGSSAQIGRIVGYAGLGENAQVTDYGWDAAQRLVAMRSPLADDAIASGVVGGLGPASTEAMTTIAYDALGSVASVTAPAGLVSGDVQPTSAQTRARQSFSFSEQPGRDVFTATQDGVTPTAGFVERDDLSPSTFEVVAKTDPTGMTTTSTYDRNGNGTSVKNLVTGMATEITYNAQGLPISERGPSSGSLSSPNTPKLETSYDQDEHGVPYEGLSTHLWGNAGFEGPPASASIGPLLNGSTSPPSSLSFAYPGGSSPFAVQMSGSYSAATKADYTFTNGAESATNKLFVHGSYCRPSCVVALEAGQSVPLDLEVRSLAGAPTNVRVDVAIGTGPARPVPMSAIGPALGYPTSSSLVTQLSAASGSQVLKTKTVYDVATGAPIRTVTAGGVRSSIAYQPFTGVDGHWGQLASTTNPEGGVTTYNYFGATESATACGVSAAQGGLLSSVSDPSPSSGAPGFSTSQVYGSSGGVVAQSAAGSTTCVAHDPTGAATRVAATGSQASYEVSTTTMVDNNPMLSSATSIVGDRRTQQVDQINLVGAVVATVDAMGTETHYRFAPASGLLRAVVETTKLGQERTITYGYNRDGMLTSQSIDGTLVATYGYDRGERLISVDLLGSKVRQRLDYNANGQVRSQSYVFADGSRASEDDAYSPVGQVLRRVLTGPDGTAEFSYAYDTNLRLVGSTESGTIAVTARHQTVSFDGPQGANGDRTSSSSSDGTTTTTTQYSYDGADRLLSTSGPSTSRTAGYSAADQVLTLGASTVGYDAAGHVVNVARRGHSVDLGYDSSGLRSMVISTPASTTPRNRPSSAQTPSTTTTGPSTTTTEPSPSQTTQVSNPTTTSPGTTTTAPPETTSQPESSTSPTATPTTPSVDRRAEPRVATPTTTTAIFSGDLVLGTDGQIIGQTMTLPSGVVVGLDAKGVAAELQYPDLLGSMAWQGTPDGGPNGTVVYDPWGSRISTSTRSPMTTTPALAAVLATNGWKATSGVMTVPGVPNVDVMGARAYSTVAGRFLAPDPVVGTSMNRFEFGNGDPINNSDPTGTMSLGHWIGLLVGVIVGTVVSMATMGSGTLALAGAGWHAFMAGAISGAVSGFVGSVTQQLIDTGTVEWKDALWSSGMGAVVGGSLNRVLLGTANVFKGTRLDAWTRPIATGAGGQVARQQMYAAGSDVVEQAFFTPVPATWTLTNVVGKGLFKVASFGMKAAADATGVWNQGKNSGGSNPVGEMAQGFTPGAHAGVSSDASGQGGLSMTRNLVLAGGY